MKNFSVTFSNVTIDRRNQEKTFWFEVKDVDSVYIAGCFGLMADGTNHTASGTFNELDPGIQEKLLEIGRQLLPKVVS